MRLGEGGPARRAAVALQTISMLPELLCGLIAGWAVHFVTACQQLNTITLVKQCQQKYSLPISRCISIV